MDLARVLQKQLQKFVFHCIVLWASKVERDKRWIAESGDPQRRKIGLMSASGKVGNNGHGQVLTKTRRSLKLSFEKKSLPGTRLVVVGKAELGKAAMVGR